MPRPILLLLLYGCFASKLLSAQSSAQTLDIVSWNVEWFGSPTQAPNDDNLQETNIKKILRSLQADLYGLLEVVDTLRLRRLTDSLGADYSFVISDFCSNNTTGTGTSWLTGQKLAFIYNKTIFTNVRTRGMLRSSASAYTNFASGRFPFLFNADVTLNGVTKNINFILLHGKAGNTQADYDKRLFGAKELKDTLDTYYSSTLNLLIGDYNDALNTTICSGCTSSLSSYEVFVKDSVDNDHYQSLTLPLANAGQSSMINFPNVVDNHLISNEVKPFYIPGSVKIRTDVTTVVPGYLSNNTSDHYPVFSQYNLAGLTTGIQSVPATEMQVTAYPNPFGESFSLHFGKTLNHVRLQLSDAKGRKLWHQTYSRLPAGTFLTPALPALPPGIYLVSVLTGNQQVVKKMIRL